MPNDEVDETDIQFQEAFGARLFRQGKPRAVLEVKSPNIPTAIYEARLRGYDRAKAHKERKEGRRGGPSLEPPTKSSRSSVGSRDGQ